MAGPGEVVDRANTGKSKGGRMTMETYRPGQEITITANTYMGGTQSDHIGKIGTIDHKAKDDRGYWVKFPNTKSPIYFEPEEITASDWYPYEYYPEEERKNDNSRTNTN